MRTGRNSDFKKMCDLLLEENKNIYCHSFKPGAIIFSFGKIKQFVNLMFVEYTTNIFSYNGFQDDF